MLLLFPWHSSGGGLIAVVKLPPLLLPPLLLPPLLLLPLLLPLLLSMHHSMLIDTARRESEGTEGRSSATICSGWAIMPRDREADASTRQL
eukprot:COSAG06_NODE_1492_length_9279_cov_835.540632_7_plen_91_part_00